LSVVHAAVDAPSAELLLYLAEFADENGTPEDPLALEPASGGEPDDKPSTDATPSTTTIPDDAKADAKPAAKDR